MQEELRKLQIVEMQHELSRDSGKFESNDPLAAFLYVLMRDVTSSGVVERLVMDALVLTNVNELPCLNSHLAKYAQSLATMIEKERQDREQRKAK